MPPISPPGSRACSPRSWLRPQPSRRHDSKARRARPGAFARCGAAPAGCRLSPRRGSNSAALDARLLLCAALGLEHLNLVREPDRVSAVRRRGLPLWRSAELRASRSRAFSATANFMGSISRSARRRLTRGRYGNSGRYGARGPQGAARGAFAIARSWCGVGRIFWRLCWRICHPPMELVSTVRRRRAASPGTILRLSVWPNGARSSAGIGRRRFMAGSM